MSTSSTPANAATPAVPSIGVFLPSLRERSEPPADVTRAASHAECLGFDSVWAVDQLIGGSGLSILDSTVTLTAAAAVTTRVRLGFGVLIAPLHPTAWVAKQVASLQHVSGDRVILGLGAGGDRHERSWAAAGVPRKERGRRTDAALRALPDLIAGKPVRIDGRDDPTEVQLTPGATVPPIVVGGVSDSAIERVAAHADGWLLMPSSPADAADGRARVADRAAAHGRAVPRIIGTMMVVIDGDPAAPDSEQLRRSLTDPDGIFGIPDEAIDMAVVTGDPAAIAQRLAAFGEHGVDEMVVTIAAGDWFRQTELLAEARSMLA